MKKSKILMSLLLTAVIAFSMFAFSACKPKDPEVPPVTPEVTEKAGTKNIALNTTDNNSVLLTIATYIDENGVAGVTYGVASENTAIAGVSSITSGKFTITAAGGGTTKVNLNALKDSETVLTVVFNVTVTDTSGGVVEPDYTAPLSTDASTPGTWDADLDNPAKWSYMTNNAGASNDGGTSPYFLADESIRFVTVNQAIELDAQETTSFMINATDEWEIRFKGSNKDNHTNDYFTLKYQKNVYTGDEPEGALVIQTSQTGEWAALTKAGVGYNVGEWNQIDISITKEESVYTIKLYVNGFRANLAAPSERAPGTSITKGNLEFIPDGAFTPGNWFMVKVWDSHKIVHLGSVANKATLGSGVRRVAAVGDGITFGSGLNNLYDSYPVQLQAELGNTYNVVNFAIEGATTVSYLTPDGETSTNEYMSSMLFMPDIVLILLGTNDATNDFMTSEVISLSIQALAAGYLQVAEILEKNIEIFIATSPVAYTSTTATNDAIAGKVVTGQKDAAAALDTLAALVDLNDYTAGMSQQFAQSNGLHPTKKGSELLAKIFSAYIGGTESTLDADFLAEYQDIIVDDSTIDSIGTMPAGFFTEAGWAAMANEYDGDTPELQDDRSLKFDRGNMGTVNSEFNAGGTTHYTFMFKTNAGAEYWYDKGGDNWANASEEWGIRFGASSNDDHANRYYLGMHWNEFFIKNGTFEGEGDGRYEVELTRSSKNPCGYVPGRWTRIDIVMNDVESGDLTIKIYINGQKLLLTQKTSVAGITYDDGNLIDSSATKITGGHILLKQWAGELFIKEYTDIETDTISQASPITNFFTATSWELMGNDAHGNNAQQDGTSIKIRGTNTAFNAGSTPGGTTHYTFDLKSAGGWELGFGAAANDKDAARYFLQYDKGMDYFIFKLAESGSWLGFADAGNYTVDEFTRIDIVMEDVTSGDLTIKIYVDGQRLIFGELNSNSSISYASGNIVSASASKNTGGWILIKEWNNDLFFKATIIE